MQNFFDLLNLKITNKIINPFRNIFLNQHEYLLFIFFVIILSLFLPLNSFAQDHSGNISSNDTWSGEDNITGDVIIEDGVTVTIESGTNIDFEGDYYILVRGTLDATSTTFTSYSSPSAGSWKYIEFDGADAGSRLSSCTIQYGGSVSGDYGSVYIYNSGGNVSISGGIIEDSGDEGVVVGSSSSPTISNVTIRDNASSGIYCRYGTSSPEISGCTINNNNAYPIRIFSDNVGNITGSMNISGNTNNAIRVDSDAISNTGAWADHGVPYEIRGDIDINDAATLTIDPGNVLKFNGNYHLRAWGALVADGIASNHITFTSNNSIPSKGDWEYIMFDGAESGSKLDYCDISYGGSSNGNVYIYNSGSNVTISNCTIEESPNDGIEVDVSSSPTISSCTIQNNSNNGIHALYSSSDPGISGGTIQNNGNYAIRTYADNVADITGTITISGNTKNAIGVGSETVTGTSTWLDHGVPYEFKGDITVHDAAALTIDPGCVLEFDGDYELRVYGSLVADGTSSDHITFTSNALSPSSGDWKYIHLEGAESGTLLDFCDIRYGGSIDGAIYDDQSGGNVTISNSTIEQSANHGVYIYLSSPTLRGNKIQNNTGNGVYITTSANPDLGANDTGDKGRNTIINNDGGNYQVYNNTSNTIDAYYNYWGSGNDTESEIEALIYDFDDNTNKGEINFNPWLNNDQSLPVVLSIFTAQYLNNEAQLYWQTSSETDNVGWNIYRNQQEEFGSATKINKDLIPGHGTTTEPHDYTFADNTLQPQAGSYYYYWIENIDLTGQTTINGPTELYITPGSEPGNNTAPAQEHDGLYDVKNNPFQPGVEATAISFTLQQKSAVDLSVFNVKGQLLKTLYNGCATSKNLTWDGKDDAGNKQQTGVYLYRLKVNGKTYDTQKVILVR